jgi:ADP-ribose pyrophosphatase YjhB (NUDIX family)
MNFCSRCGHALEFKVPEGDNLPRHVCPQCHTIHYQNPKIVAGCLPVWEDKILLCKRAIEPQYGKWTLPAGFMENDETLEQAALRESREEANANVRIDRLYAVVSLPHINQVYMMFLGALMDQNFSVGDETLEVKLFAEAEIPWSSLAFRTIHFTLERFFEERRHGHFGTHTHAIYGDRYPKHGIGAG